MQDLLKVSVQFRRFKHISFTLAFKSACFLLFCNIIKIKNKQKRPQNTVVQYESLTVETRREYLPLGFPCLVYIWDLMVILKLAFPIVVTLPFSMTF